SGVRGGRYWVSGIGYWARQRGSIPITRVPIPAGVSSHATGPSGWGGSRGWEYPIPELPERKSKIQNPKSRGFGCSGAVARTLPHPCRGEFCGNPVPNVGNAAGVCWRPVDTGGERGEGATSRGLFPSVGDRRAVVRIRTGA